MATEPLLMGQGGGAVAPIASYPQMLMQLRNGPHAQSLVGGPPPPNVGQLFNMNPQALQQALMNPGPAPTMYTPTPFTGGGSFTGGGGTTPAPITRTPTEPASTDPSQRGADDQLQFSPPRPPGYVDPVPAPAPAPAPTPISPPTTVAPAPAPTPIAPAPAPAPLPTRDAPAPEAFVQNLPTLASLLNGTMKGLPWTTRR